MEFGERQGGTVQGGGLAEHVHAPGGLDFGSHSDELRRVRILLRGAVDTLRGDARPAEIEHFQLRADLLGGMTLRDQLLLLLPEADREGGIRAAGGVPWSGFEQHGAGAPGRLILERRSDRAGGHRLLGEQVGRPEQRAHLDATIGQRRRHRRDHGGGVGVVHPSGEQHVAVRQIGRRYRLQEDVDHHVPEHEARSRADVSPALPTLEHEPAGTVGCEQLKQARRRDVQVGRNAGAFQA